MDRVFLLLGLTNIFIKEVELLTGHVCRRQKEEIYRVTTNRAFLCSERYTTSCGHLDWRRCTKYRVQTCYTPSERYAVRYREIEECCLGWQQVGGSCSVPVCHGLCQNGGQCVAAGALPHCTCSSGYHGDLCQHKEGDNPGSALVPAWLVPVVVVTAIAGAAIAVVIVVFFFRKSSPHAAHHSRSTTNVIPVAHTNSSQGRVTSPSAPSYEENRALPQ